jgi:hypothetical protein
VATSGLLPVVIPPSNSVVTSIGQTISTVTLLASNGARKGAIIFNTASNKFLFVKLGSGATISDYSVRLMPGVAYELEFPAYTGIITGTWDGAGSGDAKVTELS